MICKQFYVNQNTESKIIPRINIELGGQKLFQPFEWSAGQPFKNVLISWKNALKKVTALPCGLSIFGK